MKLELDAKAGYVHRQDSYSRRSSPSNGRIATTATKKSKQRRMMESEHPKHTEAKYTDSELLSSLSDFTQRPASSVTPGASATKSLQHL